jgi:hypothetical protein
MASGRRWTLRRVLTAALRRAGNEDREIVQAGVAVLSSGEHTTVDVIVQRLTEPDAVRGLFRVSLDAARAEPAPRKSSVGAERTRPGRSLRLERELQLARIELQGTIEERLGVQKRELFGGPCTTRCS